MRDLHPQNRPIISVILSPKFYDDWEKLQDALSALTQQDQDMRTAIQPTQRRVIVSGMGESHLEVICNRLERESDVPLQVERPTVICVETIRKRSAAEGKYTRQVQGRGQYAHVKLEVDPGDPESGYQFVDQSPHGALPLQFVEAIDSGIREALKAGVWAGNEIVDVRVVLRDGSYHVAGSNEMAFKIAASMAFKEAVRKANPVILEPLMSIEVLTGEDLAGGIIGDLSSRRGRIEGIEPSANGVVIHAIAPLGELLGYESHLGSITQGRSSSSMQFAGYEAVPHDGGSGPGPEEIGVPANKPEGPIQRGGAASVKPDELFG
jgi:elongation factor G